MHTNKKQNSEKTTNHNSKSRGERLDVGGWKIPTSIQEENQSLEDKKNEFMMLGFRKLDGVNVSKFKEKFKENPIFLYRDKLNKLVEEGLIEVDLNNIKLTNKGLDFANLVFEEFVTC